MTNLTKNIFILAAGPFDKDRNRHLEKINGKIIISNLINQCNVFKGNLYVVINKSNFILKKYLNDNYKNIKILFPEDEKIINTFKVALSIDGDAILIVGDLIKLKSNDIQKFINTNYRAAICKYEIPWGNDIESINREFIRRGDVGDCIMMIGNEYKDSFLGKKNYERALKLFQLYNQEYRNINEYIYNDIGTYMTYAFFEEIWGKRGSLSHGEKGLINFKNQIYLDND